jgi:AcrR family transcriptional regulator
MKAAPPPPDVRTRILQAAVALLADHGVGELTQPKVARAAGVRQGHLTYYFPTRADLLLGIAGHSIDALVASMNQAARDGSLTADALADAFIGGTTDKRRVRIMLGLAVTSDRDPQLRERFRHFVATLRARIGALLAELGITLDEDTLAACHSMLVGAAVLNFARDNAGSRAELERVIGLMVERLLLPGKRAGLAKPKRRLKEAGAR